MRNLWRDVLVRLTPYDAGRPLASLAVELGVPQITRLSANENPLGPSPRVIRAVADAAATVHLYPDGGSTAVREALAPRLQVTPDQIVLGNGADELLGMIAWAAFEPGDEVIVPRPSFEPYTTMVVLTGATLVSSPLRDYVIDLDDVRARVTPRTKAIVLCSPHNPATTIVRRAPLEALLDALGPDGPLVVLDEAYHDFCDDPEYPDGVTLLARYPRLLVLRTFSKIAGLAGLRVGYGVGAVEAIDRLNRVRAPYNVNRLGQVAAVAALDDTEHRDRTRALVLTERAFLGGELRKRGFEVPPSQANFLLVRVRDAGAAHARLLEQGILVRDGAGIGFPGHLRISVGTRDTNEHLLRGLEGFAPARREAGPVST